ncbi:MAG: DUF6599 family protein [Acidobacteriota bacterium]
MKKIYFLTILILLVSTTMIFPMQKPSEGTELFPAIEGFTFDGGIDTYTPDTLFEYINGGADLFLNFEFVKLHSLRYKNEKGGEITVDIYIHEDLPNGFGIYTQERPGEGNFIKTGTEGYYEEGVLNFFKGPAYVKISCFDLGENEESILKKLAENISGKISFPIGYPDIFSKFPEEKSIKGSDKYINLNFLGHSFLNKVYFREYSIGEKTLKFFVILNGTSSEIEKALAGYTEFIKKKGGSIKKEGGIVRFTDPYYKKEGKMNILVSGDILAGMFSDDSEIFMKMTKHLVNKKK